MSQHGTFHWNELNTREPAKARDFYAQMLGWTFDEMPDGDGIYLVAKVGDRMVGGIFEMKGKMFDGIPSHWLPYLAVDDVDASTARIADAGGEVIRPPWDVPGVGRVAIVRDPTGAVSGWMTPAAT